MPEAAGDTPLQLCIRRTFDSPREHVFKVFTDPEAIKLWWNPGDGSVVLNAEVDLRVGGNYCFAIETQVGYRTNLRGTYVDVRPPERLVYTFSWDGALDIGETLVTVEFRARGNDTEMILTHERLRAPTYVDFHSTGWNAVLDQLARLLPTV
jgi:uncharacterized protein YndB with AHSA1/START domain